MSTLSLTDLVRTVGRLESDIHARVESLKTLSRLTHQITVAAESPGVFDAVSTAAMTLLGAEVALVWVARPEDGVLRLESCAQAGEDGIASLTENGELPRPGELELRVFESMALTSVLDTEHTPGWPPLSRGPSLRAWAGVPLVARNTPVGVLSIFFGARAEFTAREVELMRLLADHAAITIQNSWSAQSLRSAYAQTEDLLASISWILIAVEANTIVRWNTAAEAAFGLSANAVIGQPLADAGIPWDWPDVSAYIEEAQGKSTPTKLDDVRYQRAGGRDGFLSLILTPLKGSSGFLLLGTDITDRRLLESQITQNQKLESIGELAAGVAHELNTPIQFVGDNVRFLDTAFDDLQSVISAYRELRRAAAAGAVDEALLREDIDRAEAAADLDYLGEEIPRAISQTLEGITRVATIVRALKELAHPDRKEKVTADLNQALRSTLIVARNEIKYVAEVETDFEELPLLPCWPGEMSQVFLNIIVNAAHAIGEVVGDSGRKGLIRVQTRHEGDTAVIAISDTGGGIPAAIANKVFDPFFTTKAIGRGTGQGLAIARSVVIKHGGTLTFETEPGHGTTFFIRVPINESQAVLETVLT